MTWKQTTKKIVEVYKGMKVKLNPDVNKHHWTIPWEDRIDTIYEIGEDQMLRHTVEVYICLTYANNGRPANWSMGEEFLKENFVEVL